MKRGIKSASSIAPVAEKWMARTKDQLKALQHQRQEAAEDTLLKIYKARLHMLRNDEDKRPSKRKIKKSLRTFATASAFFNQ